ncbi:MAG TPA: hypothetical protein VGP58_11650 [Pyrinomonadaceae bacterium]|nr:hypothetical protein [Pyrinomonadaceae bacterium]
MKFAKQANRNSFKVFCRKRNASIEAFKRRASGVEGATNQAVLNATHSLKASMLAFPQSNIFFWSA